MDASPPPRQFALLLLEVSRAPEGRLEGRVRTVGTGTWEAFSGVLELLKVLEEHS
jgi:hypothetical protein